MRLPTSLRTYLGGARSAFSHAPVEIILGLLLAGTLSVAVRHEVGAEWWSRVAVGVAVALPIMFGLSVLRARGTFRAATSWIIAAVTLAVVGGYARWIFVPGLDAEWWRAVTLVSAAVLALPLVAVPGVGDRERVRRRVWKFSTSLLLRVLGVVAYAALLYAALAGAVAAISSLFELRTPEHLYADLAGIVFLALVPWLVAGGVASLASGTESAEEEVRSFARRTDPAARTLSLLGRFLYSPVVGIYLLILYAYTVKVLSTGDLPKNLLSPLILFAGLVGFLGAVLLEPLRHDPDRRGIDRFLRSFPLLLLPLLPLAVYAVGLRFGQYGWTEFRYLRFALLITLVVLSVFGTARLLRRRRPLLVSVPATLAAMLLLASVGPWSAQAISRRDQQDRLRLALNEAGLLNEAARLETFPDSSVTPTQLTAEHYERIAGSISYLYEAHGVNSLRNVIPGAGHFPEAASLIIALRVEAGCRVEEVQHAMASLPLTEGIPDLPGGTLYRIGGGGPEMTRAPTPLQLRMVNSTLEISGADGDTRWRARVDIGETAHRVAAKGTGGCGRQRMIEPPILSRSEAVLPLIDEVGRHRGTLIITSLAVGWDTTSDAMKIHDAQALVLLR